MADLIVDVGNSFTKLALFAGGVVVRSERFEHTDRQGLHAFIANEQVDMIGYASVGVNDHEFLESLAGIAESVRVTSQSRLPIETAYESRETLGVDRIANAVAVRRMADGAPALAIDTGTCLTYDLVTGDGVHLGGAISPGIDLRSRAMNEHSANLPLVKPFDRPGWLGTDTRTSLESGVFNGITAEMDGFIDHFRKEYPDLYVCITGGDAFTFQPVTKNTIFADPFLTLRGIHEILRYQ